jgi:hypothetical protein
MSKDLTQNLKLHFTFGSETLNITKDVYLVMQKKIDNKWLILT